VSILTEPTTDIETTDREGSSLDSDWWCIQTDPMIAPAPCNHTVSFVCGVMQIKRPYEPCHLIIVWAKRDDESILSFAALCQKRGRHPQIVQYNELFGPWINYDNYKLYGGPDK